MNGFMRFEFQVDFKNVRHIAAKSKSSQTPSRLCQSLTLSHQLEDLFQTGKAKSFRQASEWLNLTPARLSQILSMKLLSPVIQEKIMFADPKEIDHITENDLREVAVKMDWEEQQREWKKLLSKTSKAGK